MDKEKKYGLMSQLNMKGTLLRELRKDTEYINGVMVLTTKDVLKMGNFMEKENIDGLMVVFMMVNGKIIR
jgi:dihydrodipicolinate synthase/N-acetylneuraminate lyase